VSARIVLLGATGYTGELTARALVARGARPVLAGRAAARLTRLAGELGGADTAVVDVRAPGAVRALLEPGDVLVSTVGPFVRLGHPTVEAAIARGATYLDSTGEPAFIREVFERHGPRAQAAGCALLPATGYESVPGNLAASLALDEAGETATAVEVGYFATGDFATSGGTRASFALAALEPGFALRAGRLVAERSARRVRAFEVDGRRRPAVSAGMAEHLALPRVHPGLRDVDAYLGWYGRASRPLQLASLAGAPFTRSPAVRRALTAVAARLVRGSTGGPDANRRARSGSHVVATTRDAAGRALSQVRLAGIDGYDFTANVLAWAATRAAAGALSGTGTLGPVEAFGLARLEAGCAEAGLHRLHTY
jgi:short subunit dehydrogenase-like uncharacterized protein